MRPSVRSFQSLASVAAFLVGVASMATVATALDPTRAGDYVALPGVREFSGRLIVRPIQPEIWWAEGLDAAESATRVSRARSIAEAALVYVRVPQTDESHSEVPPGES